MRTTKLVLGAAVLWLGLGCSGLTEVGKQLSGANMEISEGSGAELPADFPLPPPAGAKLVTVAKVGLMGVDTTTAVYEVASKGDADAAMTAATDAMKAAGMDVTDSTSDETHAVTGTKGTTTWTATATPQDDAFMVTLTLVDAGGT
ncbi:MAG: hypothetical protein H6738_00785 [Alphaproteobacteria bacterium]|nr:hypothetical protein [Alphaproteobacteria bacterium]MCB9695304.1 hypothetical protein [Alphaproteobacteria bacterium]